MRKTRRSAAAGTPRGPGADAELLFYLAGSVLRGEHALTAQLGRLRETFAQEHVTLLEHRGEVRGR